MQPPEPTAEPLPERAEDLPDPDPAESELLLEELLVSEISIDGMCGVY